MEIGPESFAIGAIMFVLLCLAGLLFLLVRTFTKKLCESEKITLKTKRSINWGFVILVILVEFFVYKQLTNRTPGTFFIEKVTHIGTPDGTIILRDQYQNFSSDYSIECTLKFDQKGNKAYIQAIKSSPLFDTERFESSDLNYMIQSDKGVWCRTDHGYRFDLFNDQHRYNIYFDTLTRKLYYEGGSF